MISKKMQDALNKQINAELFSSYLYLAMSAFFDQTPYVGFSQWMKLQSEEETKHAMRFYKYVVEAGGKVVLDAIEKPKASWSSPAAAFEAAYEHEVYITDRINKLVDLAAIEKDNATKLMLDWFVNEQVEEESTVLKIVDKFKFIGDNKNGLLMFDKELGKRGK